VSEGRTLFRVCKILSKLFGRGGREVCERKISYMYILWLLFVTCVFRGSRGLESKQCGNYTLHVIDSSMIDLDSTLCNVKVELNSSHHHNATSAFIREFCSFSTNAASNNTL
jgi:hypothetical protein